MSAPMLGTGLAILGIVSCSGPQPLLVAIRPADDAAYLVRLNAANGDGRSAFLKWMAEERRLDLAVLERRDSNLSTTRNPFDAHNDPVAIGRGAVLYKYHCARCHGDDARGRGPSTLPDHPANDFHNFANRFASTIHRGAPRRWFKSIAEGYGDFVKYPDEPEGPAMPAFGNRLCREQIWLLITYLQSLDMHVKSAEPAS